MLELHLLFHIVKIFQRLFNCILKMLFATRRTPFARCQSVRRFLPSSWKIIQVSYVPRTRPYSSSSDIAKPALHPETVVIPLSQLAKEEAEQVEVEIQDAFATEPELMGKLPPLMRSVRETMQKYKGYAVITQVGSFYELYFEHATDLAPKLNLTLAKKKFKEITVPMAGFPLSQLDRHLKVLVKDLNQGVAVSEQFKRESSIDNDPIKVARRVTRVISPGTLVDEAFLNEQENNYLLSIDFPHAIFKRAPDPDTVVGLSWIDISVGALFVQETTLGGLASSITRIRPSEILLDEELVGYHLENGDWYQELIELKKYFVKYQKLTASHKTMDLFYYMFQFPKSTLKKTFNNLSLKETSALRNLLRYIEEHFPETEVQLQLPEKQVSKDIMQIDSRTADALELQKTLRDQYVKGSLLSSVKRTVTQSGSRLLSQWISAPSTNIQEIRRRQRMVTSFCSDPSFRANIIKCLKECNDISRIVQRFSMGRGNVLDLVNLATTVKKYSDIVDYITSHSTGKLWIDDSGIPVQDKSHLALADEILRDIDVANLMKDMRRKEESLSHLIDPLADTVEDEGVESFSNDGHVITMTASKTLKRLHNQLSLLETSREKLEDETISKLRQTYDIKSGELKNSLSLGYQLYISLPRGYSRSIHLKELFPGSSLTQQSTYTRWYSFPPWTSLGNQMDSTRSQIVKEENRIIKALMKKVIKKSITLREVGKFLDILDVTSSFAVLVKEKDLVRPEVNDSTSLDIIGGRHMVVEDSLKQELGMFSSNDLLLGPKKSCWIISGPNMGGKSTFLRQNAIIVILAQIGCYVPAKSAKIGIVDKMFSRVNSADDLANNMSTFMVEMVETSYILNGATERSLAILDEIGRGTSADEGTAVAYATLNHLSGINNCRVLFSTHYGHELHRLFEHSGKNDKLTYKKVRVKRQNGKIVFLHTLVDGISDKSYAIDVAEKAGFPQKALEDAIDALEIINGGKDT